MNPNVVSVAYERSLSTPQPRDTETRSFSRIEGAQLRLDLDHQSWAAASFVEIDFLLRLPGRKVALHFPRIQWNTEMTPRAAIALVEGLLESAMDARGLDPNNEISIDLAADGSAGLVVSAGRILAGQLSLCVVQPPPPPIIEAVFRHGQDERLASGAGKRSGDDDG